MIQVDFLPIKRSLSQCLANVSEIIIFLFVFFASNDTFLRSDRFI